MSSQPRSNPPGWQINPVSGEWEQTPKPGINLTDLLTVIANKGPQATSYGGAGIAVAGVSGLMTTLPPNITDIASAGAQTAIGAISGNIPMAVASGLIFASGVLSIIRNEAGSKQVKAAELAEKSKPQFNNLGVTDEQIKTAIAAMSADDIDRMLSNIARQNPNRMPNDPSNAWPGSVGNNAGSNQT